MKQNEQDKWYYKIAGLLKLETITPHGRFNLGGVGLLVICILIYSAGDTVKHFISAAEDTIKTYALGEDVYHPYETSDVVSAVLPVLIGLGFCLLYLYVHERKKEEIEDANESKKQKSEN